MCRVSRQAGAGSCRCCGILFSTVVCSLLKGALTDTGNVDFGFQWIIDIARWTPAPHWTQEYSIMSPMQFIVHCFPTQIGSLQV